MGQSVRPGQCIWCVGLRNRPCDLQMPLLSMNPPHVVHISIPCMHLQCSPELPCLTLAPCLLPPPPLTSFIPFLVCHHSKPLNSSLPMPCGLPVLNSWWYTYALQYWSGYIMHVALYPSLVNFPLLRALFLQTCSCIWGYWFHLCKFLSVLFLSLVLSLFSLASPYRPYHQTLCTTILSTSCLLLCHDNHSFPALNLDTNRFSHTTPCELSLAGLNPWTFNLLFHPLLFSPQHSIYCSPLDLELYKYPCLVLLNPGNYGPSLSLSLHICIYLYAL
jgi:hypothetical protein